MTKQLKVATRRELIEAVARRYQAGTRAEKKQLLDELIKVTGFHRKHALRVLKRAGAGTRDLRRVTEPRARRYNEAVQQALIILWEASDRLCGKRLKEAIPALVEAMERHGHLQLDAEVRLRLGDVSAATLDRLLAPVRQAGKSGRRRAGIRSPLRNAIAVRTFGDWHDPVPGYFEMDLVAHCGKSVVGSYVHSLVLTDIASGWTECAAMVMREQTLVIQTLEQVRAKLPVPMLGLDVDNDSAFINETLVSYCRQRGLELTRCRAYRKNDQAWIEQKNGAVVRRLAGYGRLEGRPGAAALARLHEVARLHVNFFQPCFKLKSKRREGAKVIKQYHRPATPCERLLASDRVSREGKEQLRQALAALDPVDLLRQIREAQRELVALEVGGTAESAAVTSKGLSDFVESLSRAWRDGEVRPTHCKPCRGPRMWRTRVDPFEGVWSVVEQWLLEQPEATAKELFERLQAHGDEAFGPGQLRTLQRRVKQWRSAVAHRLVFGQSDAAAVAAVLVGGVSSGTTATAGGLKP
jgi:hypothetical protein